MKKITALLLILFTIIGMIPNINVFADNDAGIVKIADKYAVSVRYVFEKLGAKVSCVNNTYTITKGNNTIKLTIGSKYAFVNKQKVEMDMPVTLMKKTNTGKVSMKFIEKYDTLFGYDTLWDVKAQVLKVVKYTAPVRRKVSFGMVTDIGGLGDKSFNDSAWSGLVKAGKQFGVDPLVIQSAYHEDYNENVKQMSETVDLTIGIGFLMEDAIKTAAELYPNKRFGIIDSVVEKPNVVSITFKENEGSFLAGVVAGLTTKTDTVGFIGGMDIPIIKEFEIGFRAGVASVNPDAKVLINYTGVFDNPNRGKEAAIAQHSQNADVIYHASGACWYGIVEAADEYGFWAIGVDGDQSGDSKNNRVLCSMVKRVDVATYIIAKSLADNTFKGGNVLDLGLLEDGVGYSDNGGNVTDKVAEVAEKYKSEIIKGKIIVPDTDYELNSFKPVKLK